MHSLHIIFFKARDPQQKKIRGDTGVGRWNEKQVHTWFPDCVMCTSHTADELQHKEGYLALLHTDRENMVNFAFHRHKMIQENTNQEE